MPKSDVQTSLRLPEDLRDRLATEAAENGHGIGEEMRQRLEASFKTKTSAEDQNTGYLQFEIGRCAQLLAQHWVAWHADAEAWSVFKAAVNHLLDEYKPETTGTPKSRDAAIMFDGEGAGERLALSVFWHTP
jgi:hypothetical protein